MYCVAVDWPAVAVLLAERTSAPIVLLDRAGRIRLFNSAMEQLLGITRFQAEGRPLDELCWPRDSVAGPGRWIAEAFRGKVHGFEALMVATSGKRFLVQFELMLVGRGGSQGVVAGAKRVAPVASDSDSDSDIDYEVALDGTTFGQLLKLAGAGGSPVQSGMRCYAAAYGREQPCPDCPLIRSDAEGWPRFSVRYLSSSGSRAPGAFRLSTAEKLSESVARVRTRQVTEAELSAIHDAKLKQIADRANLSQRERDVLNYLLMGRSIEDIAALLEITHRTVKYHQANLLQKTGADSRADLVRLLL